MKRCAEWVLWAGGAALFVTGSWNILTYAAFQRHPAWFLKPIGGGESISTREGKSLPGRILGRIEIPRIGLSVLVLEGDDDTILSLGAGHVPGTANFGLLGNTVVAAHRDMAFRGLSRIRRGDRIRVEAGATYDYLVDQIKLVDPNNVSVLDGSRDGVLTLITCYPFRYLGDAPKRYIVRANLCRPCKYL